MAWSRAEVQEVTPSYTIKKKKVQVESKRNGISVWRVEKLAQIHN
jgi:hypothetical protein